MLNKSRTIKDNFTFQSHKSVQFNEINSTKVIPNLLNTKDKIDGTSENDKILNNSKILRPSNIISRNNRKLSLFHANTIKSPDYLNKLLKNNIKGKLNNINTEEGFKQNETSNYFFNSTNKINNQKYTSLIKNSMTPQNRMQIKRLNSINVNVFIRNNLKNNLNSQKNNESTKRRNSINSSRNDNLGTNYNLKTKNFLRKTSTFRIPLDSDKANLYLRTLYATKVKKKPPKIINPLQIPDEDKIFDEMQEYLCYKYETKRLNAYENKKKEEQKSKIRSEFKIKDLKPKLKTEDKIRLNYLYLATNKISNKIYTVKRKKLKSDLITYQKNLLDVIKPSITDYSYMYLKDRLFDIRKKNNKKYQYNYRKLKEIESEEKEIINQFNETCERCEKHFKKIKEEKDILHSVNLDIKLPTMTFVSCLKKNKSNNDKYQKKYNKFKIKSIKGIKNNNAYIKTKKK